MWMAARGLIARIPLWIRVMGTISVVLVGIIVGAMLLDTSGGGPGHGPGNQNRPSEHGSGGDRDPGEHGGGHDTGDDDTDSDRSGHDTGAPQQ